jgi:hypothetical protein
MSLVAFSSLPDDARVWVFGAAEELPSESEAVLLSAVDGYLDDWRAHGSPLTVGRDWRDRRFLAIAVDQSDANASGCSLDALFRVLQGLEQSLGAALLGNARVYFRNEVGTVQVTDRAGFAELAHAGSVNSESHVFDLSVQTIGQWRDGFEVAAANAWHNALLPVVV